MRKNRITRQKQEFSILALDDDRLMTETLESYFTASGYQVTIENDPLAAIERVRTGEFDIMLLDFLMRPICGDEVVRRIREFNSDLFIILLTGHKSMAPPVQTIRELDIQGYYEKSDRFDQLELLVESCVKSIRQTRTIQKYRDGLADILECVSGIGSGNMEIDALLDKVLEGAQELLPCTDTVVCVDLSGFGEKGAALPVVCRGSGFYKKIGNPQAFLKSHTCNGLLISEEDGKTSMSASLFVEEFGSFGMMMVLTESRSKQEEVQLFQVYARQMSITLSNLILQRALHLRNRELEEAYASTHSLYMGTIDAMRKMVDAKDWYTRGHSDRVSYYAVKIAQAMGLNEAFAERIRVAGMFHDIGKVGIPDEILRKNGSLTETEYAEVKEHPSLGVKILSSISSFSDILSMVEGHHERFDGKGYPKGLAGEAIPLGARIICVADAFDAMTSKRSYRGSMSLEEAKKELWHCKNQQFDGKIVDVFLRILEEHYDSFQKEMETLIPETTLIKNVGGES